MSHNPKPQSVVGGGFVVLRRGICGRHEDRLTAHKRPFEHPSLEVARQEAARLAAFHGADFCVFQQVDVVPASAAPASSTDEAA